MSTSGAAQTNDAETTRFWEGFTRAHNVLTAALEKEMLPESGVPLAWFEVLHHLTRAPAGQLRFQDLARVAGITDSGASRRLDQMIKAGLIERRTCPTDRRGVFAHITDKGQTAHRRALAVVVRSLKKNLGGRIEACDVTSISAALERLS